jgi:UDP-glucose 4-epimerase
VIVPWDRGRRHAWVIGVTSFLGRRVSQQLAAVGYGVTGFARRDIGDQWAKRWGFTSVYSGTFEFDLFERAGRQRAPSVVFHAVGSGSIGQAEEDPGADLERTLGTTQRLIDALCQLAPSARLIYPSSAAVYGAVGPGPISEDSPTHPISIYGQNKLLTEELCRRESHKLDIVIARFFSVYGPPQRKLLLWELGERLRSGYHVVELGGTGEETRDFIHVGDAAAIAVALAEAPRHPGIVNVGTGRASSIRTLVSMYARILKVSAQIRFSGQPRPGDPPHQQADVSRLMALGVGPHVPLEEGLVDYAGWLSEAQAVNAELRQFE